jgi:hypothetical protein
MITVVITDRDTVTGLETNSQTRQDNEYKSLPVIKSFS